VLIVSSITTKAAAFSASLVELVSNTTSATVVDKFVTSAFFASSSSSSSSSSSFAFASASAYTSSSSFASSVF
jgi:hypothetical protein